MQRHQFPPRFYFLELRFQLLICKREYLFNKQSKTTKNKDNKLKKKDKSNQSHFLNKAVSFFIITILTTKYIQQIFCFTFKVESYINNKENL